MLRITVPPDVQQTLSAALTKAGDRECGGVLMGEHLGHNHFAVRSVTIQRVGTIASFLRGLKTAVNAIKDFCSTRGNDFARFNYLGEWHSHPLFTTHPSPRDHATMRENATDIGVGAHFLVLLIFRLQGDRLEGSAHTYLPDGSVHPSQLEMEGHP